MVLFLYSTRYELFLIPHGRENFLQDFLAFLQDFLQWRSKLPSYCSFNVSCLENLLKEKGEKNEKVTHMA